MALPGSTAFYAYKNANKSWELLDNLIWSHAQHLVTVGAGVLLRSSNGYLTAGQGGEYIFPSIVSFALGEPLGPQQPVYFSAPVDRAELPNFEIPDFNRTYQYTQYFLFAQDTFKITRRLTVNYGIRYEFYGGPSNTAPLRMT